MEISAIVSYQQLELFELLFCPYFGFVLMVEFDSMATGDRIGLA